MRFKNKWTSAASCGLIAGVLFLLISAVPLSGQTFEQRVDGIVSQARLRFGPLRFQPVLEFSQFGWISNIYGIAQTEHLVSDFVITPSPKLNVYFILRRRLILSFTENPEYYFYLKSHKYNHFANNYRAELAFPFFGSLIINAGFYSQSQRALAVAELDRQVETLGRGITAEVAYETGRRISFNMSGRFGRLEYKDVLGPEGSPDMLARNLNREESSGLAELRYQAFSSSTVFIRGGYAQYKFSEEETGWRDSRSIHFLFGFRFPSQGRLSGSLAAGFKRLISKEGTAKDYSGFIADTQISYRLGAATSANLGYYHDLVFSYWGDMLYYVNDGFNAGLTVNFSRFLAIRIGGSYNQLHYSGQREGDLTEGGLPPNRSDRYMNFSAGFNIPIFRGLRAGLSYHYWTRPEGFQGKRDGHLVTFDLIPQ